MAQQTAVSDDPWASRFLGNSDGLRRLKKKCCCGNAETGGHVCSPLNAPEP
jgi:hypothetical protein